MQNYDFQNLLSSFEFECFSRDILNAHEGLDLASFAEGRDGGVDLRYTYGKDGKTVIVQAKRYKDYSKLKSNLSKEVEKVKKLKPTRYMLTTSVDLTDVNKQELKSMFTPYIKNDNDILGKQDLNKLLAKHPDVELQYYKLWLASTPILVNILKKNIVNWTNFEKEEIQETIKTYVMNDSFSDALQKLINNRYVIISGEPGIGKTTLARVLIMHLLSEKFKDKIESANFEEFYYTSSSIEDLANVMQEGRRQVFFFDDFLGHISLDEGEKNFDSRIIQFIRACQKSRDKLLILTTREYILQQGLARYDNFTKGKGIEVSKCIVDMGKYSRFVRAEILYNHLVANDIPQPYINAILEDKNYLKLIDHPHYSPRVIETFITNGTHESCTPKEYFKVVKGFFDHPDSVWLSAFNRLDDVTQEALLVLNTMGTPVMYDDWREAYLYFFNQVHQEANYLKDQKWYEMVKVLQNNFIKTGKGMAGMYVEFHNPGIIDVLTRYINTNKNIKLLLLKHSYYIEQVFGVFKDDRRVFHHATVTADFYQPFVEAYDRIWNEYRSCLVRLHQLSEKVEYYARSPRTRVDSLRWLFYDYEELLGKFPGYVEKKLTQELMSEESNGDLASQLGLLEKVDLNKTNLDMDELFECYRWRIVDSADCLNLATSMEKVFPKHTDYIESDEFCDITAQHLQQELNDTSDSGLEELNETAQELCKYLPTLEEESIVGEIKKAFEDFSDKIDAEAEAYEDDYRYRDDSYYGENAWEIDNLFSTIKET